MHEWFGWFILCLEGHIERERERERILWEVKRKKSKNERTNERTGRRWRLSSAFPSSFSSDVVRSSETDSWEYHGWIPSCFISSCFWKVYFSLFMLLLFLHSRKTHQSCPPFSFSFIFFRLNFHIFVDSYHQCSDLRMLRQKTSVSVFGQTEEPYIIFVCIWEVKTQIFVCINRKHHLEHSTFSVLKITVMHHNVIWSFLPMRLLVYILNLSNLIHA